VAIGVQHLPPQRVKVLLWDASGGQSDQNHESQHGLQRCLVRNEVLHRSADAPFSTQTNIKRGLPEHYLRSLSTIMLKLPGDDATRRQLVRSQSGVIPSLVLHLNRFTDSVQAEAIQQQLFGAHAALDAQSRAVLCDQLHHERMPFKERIVRLQLASEVFDL
jgi:hypothetical protein